MSTGPATVPSLRRPFDSRYSTAVRAPATLSTSTLATGTSTPSGRALNTIGSGNCASSCSTLSRPWWLTMIAPST